MSSQDVPPFSSLPKSVCFSSFSISFFPRVCNNVADALAMHGLNMVHVSQAVCRVAASIFIRELIAGDLARHSG